MIEDTSLDQFIRDLHRHGLHILHCGGGAIGTPRKAIEELGGKYGREELIRLSWKLLFETPMSRIVPYATASVAHGILYHLADAALLGRLVSQHERWLAGEPFPVAGEFVRITRLLHLLIAGLCRRLQMPYPEGVEPLDEQEEFILFSNG